MMYPGADLYDFRSDCIKLCLCKLGPFKVMTSEMVHQNIGHAVQKQTELVSLKTVAGGPVRRKMIFVFLNHKLHGTAVTVHGFV